MGNGTSFLERKFNVSGETKDIAIGDINGDGLLDIVCLHYTHGVVIYVQNNSGDEMFTALPTIGEKHFDGSILLADINGDNFIDIISNTTCDHIVYLSGINNDAKSTSKHLRSRSKVEEILLTSNVNTTVLGAGIVIGSGSSSFEIMRDLVEKLPVMIAPKWLLTNS